MISSLRIRDFQSVEALDVDCGPITVLYGESDTGKSAVVRALYALAFNNYPKGHVRDGGAKESEISVTVGGKTVRARKGAGTNQYELDDPGTEMLGWDKVGTEVPAEVSDVLGWRVLELDDGSRFAPNFHLQFDAPFLLTDSPSKRAKVLGSLTNVATLFAAIKQANTWGRKTKANIQAQEEIKERAVERIGPLEERLEGERGAVDALMATVAQAKKMDAEITMLSALLMTLHNAAGLHRTAQAVVEMMEASEPDVDEVERLLPKLQGLRALYVNVSGSAQAVDSARAVLVQLDHVESEAEQALYEFTQENNFCPLCGQGWGEHNEA